MENVMMNSIHTQIKIVDFGLSNNYDPNIPLRTHCGSPEYAAPELFVPGRSYGPEVDLWSLGVILYGMVVGQLPFVTVREENVSSQERRKKLLYQINKGYSIPQKKALALVSGDFRALIARMLITDVLKRITVNELIYHAWVTDRGKKSVVVNPLHPLTEDWQISVMKQVGTLAQLDWSMVHYSMATEPQGNLAGMYNILAFKLQNQHLEGDGVTRSTPPKIPGFITPRNLLLSAEKNGLLPGSAKITRKRLEKVKSPSINKMVKDNSSSQRNASAKRPSTSEKRPKTTTTACIRRSSLRGESAQPKLVEKRRLLSNQIQPLEAVPDVEKVEIQWNCCNGEVPAVHLESPPRITSVPAKPKFPSSVVQTPVEDSKIQNGGNLAISSMPKSLRNEVQVVGSNGIAKVLLGKNAVIKEKELSQQNGKVIASPRTTGLECPVTFNTVKSRSVPTTYNRRASTATPVGDHSLKRNRVIPVVGHQSVPNQTPVTSRPRNRKITTATAPRNTDLTEKSLVSPAISQTKKINLIPIKSKQVERTMKMEPIARSIAGYIANNMQNKDANKRKKN